MSTPTRITHLIDGQPWTGTAERTSPVFNPATGEQTGVLDLASASLVDEVVKSARRRLGGLGRRLARQADGRAVRLPRAAQRPQGGHRRAHHGRARQGALRRARRGDPRPRGRRVRLRHPARSCVAASPRTPRPTSTSTRSASRSASSPSSRPFNFPAMVPMWFIPIAIACGNAVVLKPSREGPVGRARDRRAVEGGRPARRRHAGRQRRQGGRRRAADPPRHQVGVVRRLDPDREVRLRDGHGARQARPGPRRREEPHARAARRRPRPRRGRRRQRRLRLGGGAVHGDLGPRRGRADRRRADREDQGPDGQARHR